MENFKPKKEGQYINLTDVPTEEAIRIAFSPQDALKELVKIRVQGAIEYKVRSSVAKVAKEAKIKTLRLVYNYTRELLEECDSSGDFSRKFTSEQIQQFVFLYPRRGKMTIESVKAYYSAFDLSWRQAQKIIDKEKELFPNRKREAE